ncbi:MAG TPA: helix-turn-helix domain-containing protein [Candidatus Acidoferrum sp.]|nr:helix-turn-helix domain-containing protein [Candidatus Acidoferrum sp.]
MNEDDDFLPIGRFARLTGLSVGALRHYDELGVLRPASVDRETSYRRYRRDQVAAGRTVARLRDLEMSLDEIREVLATDDDTERRLLLEEHRRRVEARTFRLQYVLHVTGQLSRGKEPIVTDTLSTDSLVLDDAGRRRLAADLYNGTWTYLEMSDRTPAQTDQMIHMAHASRFHWGEVVAAGGGQPANLARGEWLCSRVYAVLGRAEPALWHARRCLEINESNGIADWDIAGAYEAMARASIVAGDITAAREWAARARTACTEIAEPEDRENIEADIATLALD